MHSFIPNCPNNNGLLISYAPLILLIYICVLFLLMFTRTSRFDRHSHKIEECIPEHVVFILQVFQYDDTQVVRRVTVKFCNAIRFGTIIEGHGGIKNANFNEPVLFLRLSLPRVFLNIINNNLSVISNSVKVFTDNGPRNFRKKHQYCR